MKLIPENIAKLTWDSTKESWFYWQRYNDTKHSKTRSRRVYMVCVESCIRCGEPYLAYQFKPSPFCSHSCKSFGHKLPDAAKQKLSKERKGKKRPCITGSNHPLFGKEHSLASRIKMSINQRHYKEAEWSGFRTPLNRAIWTWLNRTGWYKSVKERDGYICQACGIRGNGDLHAHHKIKVIELIRKYNIKTIDDAKKHAEFFATENGITLCIQCHKKIHGAVTGKDV